MTIGSSCAGIDVVFRTYVMTISDQTRQSYRNRTNSLLGSWRKWLVTQEAPVNDVYGFVDWLASVKKSEIGPAAFRQYKSAVVWTLQIDDAHSDPTLADMIDNLKAASQLSQEKQRGCGKSKGTSANKMKRVREQDISTLENHLEKSRSLRFHHAMMCLKTGVLTGARPVEWWNAKIIDNESGFCVRFKNAKFDELRAHGEFRHLTWRELPDDDRELIEDWMKIIADFKRTNSLRAFKIWLAGLQDALRLVCREIWPRRSKQITLYSGRHEAAARWKLAYPDRYSVAAMMGHATDETASKHYARYRRGSGKVSLKSAQIPQPLREEVSRIRQIGWEDRLKAQIAHKNREHQKEGGQKPRP